MAHDVETKLRNLWLAEYDDLPVLVADDFMHANQADAGPATPQREDRGERTLLDESIDDLTVDYLQQRPDESTATARQSSGRQTVGSRSLRLRRGRETVGSVPSYPT